MIGVLRRNNWQLKFEFSRFSGKNKSSKNFWTYCFKEKLSLIAIDDILGMKDSSFSKDVCLETLSPINEKLFLMVVTSRYNVHQVSLTRYKAIYLCYVTTTNI